MFVPERPWPGEARLRVDPALEDLAGNNLARPFDSDRLNGDRAADAAVADTTPRIVPVIVR